MNSKLKKVIAVVTAFFTILPSYLGLPFVYSKYDNAEKYDPSLGQIIVDTDMSVPRIFIAQNGTSDYVIIRGANASPSEVTAATTLQDYLNQISGVTIPVVTDTTPEQTKEIIVGKTNREGTGTYTINRTKLGGEGLNVFVYNEKLVIAGGEQRGTLYGVFTFLEEVLGCRWFTKDFTVVPQNSNISVRRSLKIEQKPYFEFRDLSWGPNYNEAISVAHKNNTNFTSTLTEKNGGGVVGIWLGHTFEILLPSSEYFETHPEYYAFTANGKRETTQLCLTNPDVLRIVTENTLAAARKNPAADFISVSQNDNAEFCRCENCKVVDEIEESHAGTLIRFVNAVAQEVEKEFPNMKVQTLIYDHTRTAPKLTHPQDNVILHLCSDTSCFSHPLEEGCLENAFGNTFAEDLEAWQKVTKNIYVYDYTTNFSHYPAPYPNFHVLQENMQYFVENNVSGVWEEGNPHLQYNGEFSHLKTYLIAKLLWDPYTDIEKHMNEFMHAFYGEGYQYIRKYIDFSCDRAQLNHIEMWSSPAKIVNFTTADLKQIDKWWDEAEKLAKNDFELDNIQASRIQLRYYKNFTQKGEFSRFKNSAATGEKLYDDFMRFGITQVGTGDKKKLKPRENIDFSKPVREWRIDA